MIKVEIPTEDFDVHNIMDAVVENEQLTDNERGWVLDLISASHPSVASFTFKANQNEEEK